MAWRRIGDMPLSEAMLTSFTDAYIWGTMGDELIFLILESAVLTPQGQVSELHKDGVSGIVLL